MKYFKAPDFIKIQIPIILLNIMKYLIILIFFFTACNSRDTNIEPTRGHEKEVNEGNNIEESSDRYSDGTWCADVEYFNPNTRTRNTYNLDVEVQDGELTDIHWPNGGWLDESHFSAEDITSGECTITSDKGYEYTVTLQSKGSCGYSSRGDRILNDVNEDLAKVTCPKCGDEKGTYDDYCFLCERKIRQAQEAAETCPKCMGFKTEWERICNSCQDELEERKNELLE